MHARAFAATFTDKLTSETSDGTTAATVSFHLVRINFLRATPEDWVAFEQETAPPQSFLGRSMESSAVAVA
jgi:hypothetical protein